MPLIRIIIGQFIHSMVRQLLVSDHINRQFIRPKFKKIRLGIIYWSFKTVPSFQEEFINYLAARGHFSVHLVGLHFLNSINTAFDIYFCNTLAPKMSFLSVKENGIRAKFEAPTGELSLGKSKVVCVVRKISQNFGSLNFGRTSSAFSGIASNKQR